MLIQTNFNSRTPGGGIGCLIFGVLGLVAAYYILKGVFTILWWAAPFLFVLTLLINWRVVAEAGKGLISLIRRQPLSGLIVTLLAAVAFPITALFLFLSAVGSQSKARRGESSETPPVFEQTKTGSLNDTGEFIDFEEIPPEPEEIVRPSEPVQKEQKKPANPYDELFKE